MAFNLFTQAQAREFGMRIINGYKQSHNIPIIGSGVILPTSPKRVANKNRQAEHRATHSRMTVWDNEDNAALLAPVKIKLNNIRTARKAYNHVLGQLHRAQKALSEAIAAGRSTIAIQQNINAINALLTVKLQALNTAKAA